MTAGMKVSAPSGTRLPAGRFLVGASRASLFPAPLVFGGSKWETSACTSLDNQNIESDHIIPPVDPADPIGTLDEIKSWPASSPDCIYLGGFGIGPARPAERVGRGGVWVRTIAISNGEKTFIYGIADTVGWFARYDSTICADCGILDVRLKLSDELGVDVGNVVIGSTHTHAGADTYGGWGGIPDWYRAQIRDAAIASAKQAIVNLRPASLTVGEVHLRNRSNERRDTYYSTVDTGATWLQARAFADPRRIIATWATFAGHPTIVGAPILHADWPGAVARSFERRFGGVGIMFEGGLGNASISGVGVEGDDEETVAEKTGSAIAGDVARSIRSGSRVTSNDMIAASKDIEHPAMTNPGLLTLASVGLFDREFTPPTLGAGPPAVYYWSKKGELSSSGEDNDPEPAGESTRGCVSSGVTIKTVAGAHRIGSLIIAFAPGEIFSNVAEVVKERVDWSEVTMVLGQSNDALGYIIQSFEFDVLANAATEYGTQTGEYEEVFAADRCIGDHVLETILEASEELR